MEKQRNTSLVAKNRVFLVSLAGACWCVIPVSCPLLRLPLSELNVHYWYMVYQIDGTIRDRNIMSGLNVHYWYMVYQRDRTIRNRNIMSGLNVHYWYMVYQIDGTIRDMSGPKLMYIYIIRYINEMLEQGT